MKATIVFTIIMTFCVMMSGCALQQQKDESNTYSDSIFDNDAQNLIAGTWKITSEHCNSKGTNCENYKGSRIFKYGKSGELLVNNVKRGSYRISGNTCIITAGTEQYTVNIIQIDSARLITGESDRTTTEIFIRIK